MATPIKMERVSKVATVSEVAEWLRSPGELVEAGEPLLRVVSDKATVDVHAPAGGVLLRVDALPKAQVPVGAVLGWIGEPGESLEPPTAGEPSPIVSVGKVDDRAAPTSVPEAPAPGKVRASPMARRLAARYELPIAGIAGTGPGGRITRADVETARQRQQVPTEPASREALRSPLEPGLEQKSKPLSGIQRTMMGRMVENVQTVAQATTVAQVDMTEVVSRRETVPGTLTAWVAVAATRALEEYPLLNASLQGDQVAYHAHVNLGVAVETDAGLIVPVIQQADKLRLPQLQEELGRLIEAARQGSLSAEDLDGATFTLTNSGVLGSVLYTPMIVLPQSAILGMGRVEKMPVVRDDAIVVRSMMYLCLSYDHRFIAGGVAVRYLQRVRQFLENVGLLV